LPWLGIRAFQLDLRLNGTIGLCQNIVAFDGPR
jgi:hypothetical protein